MRYRILLRACRILSMINCFRITVSHLLARILRCRVLWLRIWHYWRLLSACSILLRELLLLLFSKCDRTTSELAWMCFPTLLHRGIGLDIFRRCCERSATSCPASPATCIISPISTHLWTISRWNKKEYALCRILIGGVFGTLSWRLMHSYRSCIMFCCISFHH